MFNTSVILMAKRRGRFLSCAKIRLYVEGDIPQSLQNAEVDRLCILLKSSINFILKNLSISPSMVKI